MKMFQLILIVILVSSCTLTEEPIDPWMYAELQSTDCVNDPSIVWEKVGPKTSIPLREESSAIVVKGTVPVSAGFTNSMVISTSFMHTALSLVINGELRYRDSGVTENKLLKPMHILSIPPDLENAEFLVICSIRPYSSMDLPVIEFGDTEELLRRRFMPQWSILLIAAFLLFIGIVLLSLIPVAYDVRERGKLFYLGFFCVLMATRHFSTQDFSFLLLPHTKTLMYLELFTLFMAPNILLRTVGSLSNRKTVMERRAEVVSAFFAVIMTTVSLYAVERNLFEAFHLWIAGFYVFIIALCVLILIEQSKELKKGNMDARTISMGIIIFISSSLVDMIASDLMNLPLLRGFSLSPFGMLGFVLCCGLVLVRAFEQNRRELKKNTMELTTANGRMKELEKRMLKTADFERAAIGRDLHDGLGQSITALQYIIEALRGRCDDKQEERLWDSAEKVTREIQDDLHDIVRNIYPVKEGSFAWMRSVQDLSENIRNSSIVHCGVRFGESFEIPDLQTAVNVFYIVKEAVNNAMKHGKPENIEIDCDRVNESLRISIWNDGETADGIRESEEVHGLEIMAHRASLIGADLAIRSGSDSGFQVVLTLPERLFSLPGVMGPSDAEFT